MFQDLLILITIVFCLTTLVYIAKRDDLSALAYLVLFVYTIFTQIGYVHYPQLSASQNVYFGQALFYPYWGFMLLSFAACFIGFRLVHKQVSRRCLTVEDTQRFPAKGLFRCIVIGTLLYLGFGFAQYAPELHYGLMQSSEVSTGCAIFLLVNRFYALVTVILYANCVQRKGRAVSLILLVPSLILYLTIAMTVGSRADILYLAVAIMIFHLHPLAYTFRKQLTKVAVISIFAVFLLYSLCVLEYVRTRFSPLTADVYATYFLQPGTIFNPNQIAETVLSKDYYWPSHLLFVAMSNNFVDPLLVLRSDFANSLVGLHIGQLSNYVTNLADGTSQNMGGFAFHLFVEGYVAAGWLGWIYNGVVWNLIMLLCRSVIRTNDSSLNRVLTAMMAVLIPNLMRWQASGCIRALWSLFLPAFFLALLAAGKMPRFGSKRKDAAERNSARPSIYEPAY